MRVKDGMSLRNGMWHDLRNVIIMQDTIYAGNKLAEERVMFSRQFCKSSSFFVAADSSLVLNNETTNRGLYHLIAGLEEARVKKSMKTFYSFRSQGPSRNYA